MNRKSYWLLVWCLAWGAVFGLAGTLHAAKYWFHDLGIGGTGYAINDQGQVAGWGMFAEDLGHAFRWTPGNPPKMEDLGTPGLDSYGYGINNAGQVVGLATYSDGLEHAIFCAPGKPMLDLGPYPGDNGAGARAINDAGQIVGYSYLYQYNRFRHTWPCWWMAGQAGPKDLPYVSPYGFGHALAINQKGQATGYVYGEFDINLVEHACRWDLETQTGQLLGSLGGTRSMGLAINDQGQIVGHSLINNDTQRHAFLWTPEVGMEDLTPGYEGSSEATGINNRGQVIGWMPAANGFVWTRETGIRFFNEITLNLPSPNTVCRVFAINNLGEIVGNVVSGPSRGHACLLTPIPEPGPKSIPAYIPLLLLD